MHGPSSQSILGVSVLRELARRRPIATAMVSAALLTSPSLISGFFDDDIWHLGMLEGTVAPNRGAFGLYRFADGNPETMRAIVARGGFFPCWTEPGLRVEFFRPVASALTSADHALFGHHALPYHVHVVIWFLAFVAAVGLLHRRVMGAVVGGLATLLFAVDDAHLQTAGWIASRHAIVAALPCVLGLVAHLRWRQDRWRPGCILGPVAFAMGLTAGETALSVAAYVVAFELVGATGSRRDRLVALLPWAGVALAYLLFYRALGCGVHGSGAYIDPISSPRDYAAAVLPRLAAYCGDLLGGLPVDLWLLRPEMRTGLVVNGLADLALLVYFVRKVRPSRPPPETRAVLWLGVGALLSLLPGVAGFVGGRVLLAPSIGIAVVIAWLLTHGLRQVRGVRRLFCGWFAVVHVVLAPIVLFGGLFHLRDVARTTETASMTADLGPREGHVFVVGTADALIADYGPYWPWLHDARRPGSWHCLSLAPHDHLLTRTGASSFELAVVGGRMLQSEFELVFRPKGAPIPIGSEVRLDGSVVRVVDAVDGAPTRIAITADRSLDDDAYRILVWKNGALERLVLPAIGESVAVPRAIGPTGL